MQKKIIALAVAGLVSGAAFAQSNVTVYGRADIGYVYSKSDFKKFHGVEQGNGIGGGGSRIGFIGEEGLGNGLKATFKFEYGTPIDEGGATFTARYAHAGLAGNFGKVDLGRVGTPSDYYMGATSPWGINGLEPINQFRGKLGNGLIDGTRWNNSIAYSSPNFSGIDLMGIYSFGERTKAVDTDKTDPSDAGRLGLGARYANGPIYAAVVYHAQADSHAGAAKLKDGGKGWGLGGAYDFKVVKLYANYFQTKMNKGSSVGNKKETAWSLGVGVPVSAAGTVVAQYAQYKDKNVRKDDTTTGFAVGYRHTLSKRTSLYTYISQFDNDKLMNAGWQSSRTSPPGKLGVAGEKQTNFSIGILHVF